MNKYTTQKAAFQNADKSGDIIVSEANPMPVKVSRASFVPSAYSANKSATTSVAGQSEAIADGVSRLRVRNLDSTNYALIAFGTSAANAETNAANGVVIPASDMEVLGIPANATHYAWLGNVGTVLLNIVQGV
jgi:hypothetical protein